MAVWKASTGPDHQDSVLIRHGDVDIDNIQPYITASIRHDDEQRAEEAERTRRELQSARALARARQRQAVISLVFSGLVAVAAVIAWQQWSNAKASRIGSIAQGLAGQAARQQAAFKEDELAALLARQAFLFNSRNQGLFAAQIDEVLRSVLGAPFFSRILQAPTDQVTSIAFNHNPAMRTVASGNLDGSVRIWRLDSPGADPIVLTGQDSVVRTVAYSPDDRWLAAGGWDRTVRIFNLQQPDSKPTTFNGTARIWSLAFSPDSKMLAAGGEDASVKLWDLQQPTAQPTALDSSGPVASLAFSDDGQRLAAGSWDGIVSIWDLYQLGATPPHRLDPRRPGDEHRLPRINAVAFQPHGSLLASGGLDDTIRLWDLASPQGKPLVLTEGGRCESRRVQLGRRDIGNGGKRRKNPTLAGPRAKPSACAPQRP